MIPKIKIVIKRILKILLWCTASIVLLLILLALAIRIPAVQNSLVQKTTSYLSEKTKAEIRIEKILLSFPTSLSLEGILVKDLDHDTLLYASEIKANLNMYRLIKKEYVINKVYLNNITANISRKENDSTYNFNFLIKAFASGKKKDKDTSQAPEFAVNEVEASAIRFKLDDKQTGITTTHSFAQMDLTMEKLDLNSLEIKADEIIISGLHSKVELFKHTESSDNSESNHTTPKLPVLSANSIKITNSDFFFTDYTSRQSLITVISNLSVKNSEVNLNTQKIKTSGVYVGQSSVKLDMSQIAEDHPQSVPPKIQKEIETGWIINAGEIELENNAFAYNIINVPAKEIGFDPNHINYRKVSFKGNELLYSDKKIAGNINSFSAFDPKSFEIQELSTKFTMTPTYIKAEKINLKTKFSSIKADAKISFSSLSSIADSLQNMVVETKITDSKIYPFEILHFAPELVKLEFFKNNSPNFVEGTIRGPISNLQASNISIATGYSTYLKTNFTVKGLPQIKSAHFNITSFDLSSGRSDLIKLAGKNNLPSSITVPEKLQLTGKFKGYLKEFTTDFSINSSFGNFALNGNIDKQENFKGTVSTQHFDVGSFLNNKKMFGPVTLNAKINGNGLDTHTVKANISADVPKIYLNQYTYHNLTVNGTFSKKLLNGKITLNDSNAVFDLDGYVNLNKGQEQYKINLDLKGADMKKLHFLKQDVKLALAAVVDIKGKNINSVNGTAGITRIIIANKEKKYILDSLMFAAINESGKSEMHLSSAVIGMNYSGTFAPGDLIKELKNNLNTYFPIDDAPKKQVALKGPQQFSFDIQLNNHPVISEVFLPELKEFEPGTINGSFNSEKKQLELNLSVEKLVYGSIDISEVAFNSTSNAGQLTYKLTSKKLANSKIKFDNVLVEGKLENDRADTHISSTEENGNKKLFINTQLTRDAENYKLFIEPAEFFLMNEKWDVSPDNYVSFGKKGLLVHNLSLKKLPDELLVTTPDHKYDGDIHATLTNFSLEDISRIIEKDTALVKGTVNGNMVLKKVSGAYGFNTDLVISNLAIRDIEVGNLSLKANNSEMKKFNVDIELSGAGNNLTATGSFVPDENNPTVDLVLKLKPLSAKAVEAFSFGQVKEASGNIYGDFTVEGNPTLPEVNGTLHFENVTLTPEYLNSSLHLKSEKINIKTDGLNFDSFTILDKNQNPAVINGNVTIKKLDDIKFALTVNTTNFLLLNTTVKNNKQYYGTMIVDSRIRVRGTYNLPVISSSIKLKNGSHFTFALTEDQLTTDKGEGVVLFVDSLKFNRILTRNENTQKQKTKLRNFDISSTVEIDKKATIRLMLDPGSNDSLVVRGDAALSFALDPSGKTSLTGVYNLTEGSYVVSLENVVKKKFKIQPGSTITWNGDPLEAVINLSAIYAIRTSPVDLVAGQVTGTELAGYRQRYPFNVFLKLKGPILTPDISFEIQLAPGDKGAANGSINAKLEQLNDNPSALNKQVFALLVLNRFIQENPLQTETDATENAARTTVGKFLSSQLNSLSSKFVPGVDINFDIQSYDDYSAGKSEGRTQVEVGVSKQLFNERLSVQVGGAVDVEGEKAKQNNASDITGDVIVEYKITPNGRYRLKGFRNNQYQGALEGQIIQTGAGIIYVRDFDSWLQLLLKEKKDSTSTDNVQNK